MIGLTFLFRIFLYTLMFVLVCAIVLGVVAMVTWAIRTTLEQLGVQWDINANWLGERIGKLFKRRKKTKRRAKSPPV